MKNLNEDMTIKPTMGSRPTTDLAKGYERNFNSEMNKHDVHLTETDSMLSEEDFKLKRKIFSLPKMEALVFSDPKLTALYDSMMEQGKDRYGYHANESVHNQLFNDYVLNSPKYLQKYKMAVPKKSKRRDKSGINQLRKIGQKEMESHGIKTTDESTGAGSAGGYAPALDYKVEETTTSASSGAYVGPAAWGGGDLMKGGKSDAMKKPIWQGGSIIQENTNYLTDPSGFEDFINMLNEQVDVQDAQRPNNVPYTNNKVNNTIIDKTAAFSSDTVKQWNKPDTELEMHTLNNRVMDEPDKGAMNKPEKVYENIHNSAQMGGIFTNHYNEDKNAVSEIKYEISKGLPEQDAISKVADKYNYRLEYLDKIYNRMKDSISETEQSMIDDNQSSMSLKPTPTSNISAGGIQTGMNIQENVEMLNELNNELNAYSIHHNKLMKMSEDRKPSSLVLKDRLGAENQTNFKKDLQHSGTKDIINVEKELMWKDQQDEVGKDPMKLGEKIETEEIKATDAKGKEHLKNVGDSANFKGDEIPKRNMTTEEQHMVDMYRLGQQDWKYDTKPSEAFESRLKNDLGDKLYKEREEKMKFRDSAPLYNKDPQPVENKTQFEKNKFNAGISETMISGRYRDALNKSRIIDFTLNEVKTLENTDNLFSLDFTGLGNSYNSKTDNYKVSVNETVVDVLGKNLFYTDGKLVYVTNKPIQSINENENKDKPIMNEQVDKMKHLLGYEPKSFVSTNKTKINRGF